MLEMMNTVGNKELFIHMIETVWELLSTDCPTTLWMLEDKLKISREIIHRNLAEDLWGGGLV
jgi:hypothetical protein